MIAKVLRICIYMNNIHRLKNYILYFVLKKTPFVVTLNV